MTRQNSKHPHVNVEGQNTDAFASRMNVAIKHADGATRMAEKIGVSTSVLRKWRAGHSEPTMSNLINMAAAGDVDLAWLMTGEGSQEGTGQQLGQPAPDLDMLEEVISKTERMFKSRRASVTPEARAKVIRLIYEYCLRQGHQMDEASLNNVIELAAYRAAG